MLDVLPIGVIVFPGTGIQDNLADKARKLGISASPTAHAFAFSLATTLMAAIVIFRAGDGTLSVVMPAGEYDGDAAAIVREIDPFAP
jgi:hypothetical protein